MKLASVGKKILAQIIKKILNKYGYDVITQKIGIYSEYPEFIEIYLNCQEFSMTSIERMYALYNAVIYIIENEIPGDFVECGVWRGGSSMLIAETLVKHGIFDRKILLYDTFEGMTEPSEHDVDKDGKTAAELLSTADKNISNSTWCYASLDDVKDNMKKTKYPIEEIFFIKGKVEDSIPKNIPTDFIALLRLDTDWYESTLHEMTHLYPKLSTKGVLIIDDYGHWRGAKKAIDDYFSYTPKILLSAIDYTGRIGIKY